MKTNYKKLFEKYCIKSEKKNKKIKKVRDSPHHRKNRSKT